MNDMLLWSQGWSTDPYPHLRMQRCNWPSLTPILSRGCYYAVFLNSRASNTISRFALDSMYHFFIHSALDRPLSPFAVGKLHGNRPSLIAGGRLQIIKGMKKNGYDDMLLWCSDIIYCTRPLLRVQIYGFSDIIIGLAIRTIYRLDSVPRKRVTWFKVDIS